MQDSLVYGSPILMLCALLGIGGIVAAVWKSNAKRQDFDRSKSLPIWTGAILLLALAWYVWYLGPSHLATGGENVLFVLDVSRSMDAKDAPDGTSRLEFAKSTIETIRKEQPQNSYGLVVFAGEPEILSPLTQDSATFSRILSGVSSKTIRNGGSNFFDAIALAKTIVNGSGSHVVLLSDGGDKEDYDNQYFYGFDKGVRARMEIVGIGGEKGTVIPVSEDYYGNVVPLTYQNAPVMTARNDAGLTKIVQAFKGTYRIGDENLAEELQESIARNSYSNGERKKFRKDYGFVFAAIAASAILAKMIVQYVPRRRIKPIPRPWKNV